MVGSSSTTSTPLISTTNNSTTSDPQPPNLSTGIIIGASIGGSLVIIISGTAIAFFILKHKKHIGIKQNIIKMASSTDYNEMRPAFSQNVVEILSSTDRNKMRPNSQYYYLLFVITTEMGVKKFVKLNTLL